MGFVVVAVLLVVVAIIAGATGVLRKRRPVVLVAVASALLGGGVLAAGSATTVPANTVGITTEFGRYTGTIGSGFHWVVPWTEVEEFGTRIQPLEMSGTPIRFEGNSGGTADLLVEWRIDTAQEDAIERLWRDYRTFDAVQDRLVQSNARNSLNVVMAGYTPSEGVAGTSLQAITTATRDGIRDRLADTGVIVERITIRQIDPDQQSQERINRQVQAEADLERTNTTLQIAEQEARIAEARQRTQTPESLRFECLRIIADWDVNRQGPMPATLNCADTSPASSVLVTPN